MADRRPGLALSLQAAAGLVDVSILTPELSAAPGALVLVGLILLIVLCAAFTLHSLHSLWPILTATATVHIVGKIRSRPAAAVSETAPAPVGVAGRPAPPSTGWQPPPATSPGTATPARARQVPAAGSGRGGSGTRNAIVPLAGVVLSVIALAVAGWLGVGRGWLLDKPQSLSQAVDNGPSAATMTDGVLSFPIAAGQRVDATFVLGGSRRWFLHTGVQLANRQGQDDCLGGSTTLALAVYGDSRLAYRHTVALTSAPTAIGNGWYSAAATTLPYLSLGRVARLRLEALVSAPHRCRLRLDLTSAAVHSQWPLLWSMRKF